MAIFTDSFPDRTPADDYAVSMDFSTIDIFTASAVTAATVTSTPTGLTIGTATIASNVVTFNVTGGTAGVNYTVTVTVSNAAGNDLQRSARLQVR